jgi:UDP-3-O-[3-hydroxymyristoyl] glucosamine N-acyltransferase
MELYQDKSKNISIQAKELCIGSNVSFGDNIYVDVKGSFHIGDRSRLGRNVKIEGHNIFIGKDLYHSEGLRIGGGGYTNPTADFSIGDRCTIHNNYINIAEPVIIGNDVGLSLDIVYMLETLQGLLEKWILYLKRKG